MNQIEYRDLIFDKDQIKNLYLNNEWYAYTNDIDKLYNGIKNSTGKYAAYDSEKLVGFIRVVSDHYTVCYVQDILIHRDYHRKGIGTELMNWAIDNFGQCRSFMLATDNTEKQKKFYESVGFKDYNSVDCVGFTYKPKK